MYLYRELKKQSLRACLKLSVWLIVFSVLFVGMLASASSSGLSDLLSTPLGFFCLPGLWGICRLVYALCGGYQSRVRAYVKSAPDPALMLEQLEQAYGQADRSLKCFCIAGPWTLVQDGPATYLYETLDILWVYQFTQTVRRRGISSHTYYLTICDRDERLQFCMSEGEVRQCLQAFAAYAPFVVRGYSRQLSSLYENDRFKFIKAVRQRQEQTIAKQGGQDACTSTGN